MDIFIYPDWNYHRKFNMKLSAKFFIFILLLISFISTGCNDTEDDGTIYNFKVISSGESFTGYYFADVDTPTNFAGTLMTDSTTNYIYEAPIAPDESITISASGSTTDTTSITIYLFKESTKIKTVTATPTVSGGTVSALLEYSISDSSE